MFAFFSVFFTLPRTWRNDVITGVTGHEKVKTYELGMMRLYDKNFYYQQLETIS